MLGRRLVRVGGTEPSVRRRAAHLQGAKIERVEAVGKHLLIDFEGGFSLHVHLGMTGNWRLGPPRSARGDGPARVVLEAGGFAARCYQAPTVEIDRTPRIWEAIGHLGPDLLSDPPDIIAAVGRSRFIDQHRPISDVLLDQRVAAGIGNVYRNEVLFEAGIHPELPVGDITDERLEWLFSRAAGQMRRNVGGHSRTTTGARRRGTTTFVYDRAGRPCRRCGTEIEVGRSTDMQRITYWCPRCQPDASTETGRPVASE